MDSVLQTQILKKRCSQKLHRFSFVFTVPPWEHIPGALPQRDMPDG